MSDLPRIAFVGLGNMGGPMAINLKKAGYDVHAFDLSADAIAKVREQGVGIGASARGSPGAISRVMPSVRCGRATACASKSLSSRP